MMLSAVLNRSQALWATAAPKTALSTLSGWRGLPEQFYSDGDAACAFNPVYGQGMTTGALEAIELRKVLDAYAGRGMDGLGLTFQRRLAKVIAIPCLMATGEGSALPRTTGGNVTWRDRLVQKYIEQVIKLMPGNPEISDVFFQVMNLLRSPAALFQPQIMFAVLKN